MLPTEEEAEGGSMYALMSTGSIGEAEIGICCLAALLVQTSLFSRVAICCVTIANPQQPMFSVPPHFSVQNMQA
jgi:hypothetical protein